MSSRVSRAGWARAGGGGRGAVVDGRPQLAQAVSIQALHSTTRARIDDAHALDNSGLHLFGMGLGLQVGGGHGIAPLDGAQGVDGVHVIFNGNGNSITQREWCV